MANARQFTAFTERNFHLFSMISPAEQTKSLAELISQNILLDQLLMNLNPTFQNNSPYYIFINEMMRFFGEYNQRLQIRYPSSDSNAYPQNISMYLFKLALEKIQTLHASLKYGALTNLTTKTKLQINDEIIKFRKMLYEFYQNGLQIDYTIVHNKYLIASKKNNKLANELTILKEKYQHSLAGQQNYYVTFYKNLKHIQQMTADLIKLSASTSLHKSYVIREAKKIESNTQTMLNKIQSNTYLPSIPEITEEETLMNTTHHSGHLQQVEDEKKESFDTTDNTPLSFANIDHSTNFNQDKNNARLFKSKEFHQNRQCFQLPKATTKASAEPKNTLFK